MGSGPSFPFSCNEVNQMKTKYTFEVMELDDGMVAVPIGGGAERFNGVLKVNETGAAILKLLAEETDEARITEALLREYSGEAAEIRGFVREFLDKLTAEGLIA